MASLSFLRGPHSNLDPIIQKAKGTLTESTYNEYYNLTGANALEGTALTDAFNKIPNVIDGAFYLTTDTNRLYTGINGSIEELNQSIESYPDFAAIQALDDIEVGQFYYAKQQNILCICDEKHIVTQEEAALDETKEVGDIVYHWTQINAVTNTYLASTFNNVTTPSFDQRTITTTYRRNRTVDGHQDLTTNFTITADSGLHIENAGTNLILSEEPYNLNITRVNAEDIGTKDQLQFALQQQTYNANYVPGYDVASDDPEYDSTKVNQYNIINKGIQTIIPSTNISAVYDDTNHTYTISSTDHRVSSAALTPQSNGAVKIEVKDATNGSGTGQSAVFIPKIKYGVSYEQDSTNIDGTDYLLYWTDGTQTETTTTETDYPKLLDNYSNEAKINLNSEFKLAVYSKEQVDQLIASNLQSYNALEYVGGIDSQSDLNDLCNFNNSTVGHVTKGSVYTITGSNIASKLTSSDAATQTFYPGDLLIATGTEDANGYITQDTFTWVYIPAANDLITPQVKTVTTEKATGITLRQNNAEVASYVLDVSGNTNLKVSASLNNKVLTNTLTLEWGTF